MHTAYIAALREIGGEGAATSAAAILDEHGLLDETDSVVRAC
jgi:hypothetical protein